MQRYMPRYFKVRGDMFHTLMDNVEGPYRYQEVIAVFNEANSVEQAQRLCDEFQSCYDGEGYGMWILDENCEVVEEVHQQFLMQASGANRLPGF